LKKRRPLLQSVSPEQQRLFEADAPGHYGKRELWFDSRCDDAASAGFHADQNVTRGGFGGSSGVSRFLEHEVIPFVDRTYRTIPSDRGLLGHSYGGLFAIYVISGKCQPSRM
jgi:hypothetical protein